MIVVDNGSTDGSAEFVREHFPAVKRAGAERELGFGGGSNAGFRAAGNDIVVLLNNDMRVEPGFLRRCSDGFTDEKVFAVSCQIFFSDPAASARGDRPDAGMVAERRSARAPPRSTRRCEEAFPCFYGGGGSCAFDRRQVPRTRRLRPAAGAFLPGRHGPRLHGLEARLEGALPAPQRGMPRAPRHHRQALLTEKQIQAVLKKNFLLFAWKNIHEWNRLAAHFFFLWAGALLSVSSAIPGAPQPGQPVAGLSATAAGWRSSRWRARSLAAVSDTEAFLRAPGRLFPRPLPAGWKPRRRPCGCSSFRPTRSAHRCTAAPYSCSQTVKALSRLCDLHLVAMLDEPSQAAGHAPLEKVCKSVELFIRPAGIPRALASMVPHAVREFDNHDAEWLLHRILYTQAIDVLQLEYTSLAQYGGPFQSLVTALFEHDIYFQSVGRQIGTSQGLVWRFKAAFEYLRALRYELGALPRFDQIQVCSAENRAYLISFLPELADRIESDLRAGVDSSAYRYHTGEREADTLLFLGSFRHPPNLVAMEWFVRMVYPLVASRRPGARLVLAGSEPPPNYQLPPVPGTIEFLGQVEDIHDVFSRYAVFVCPVLSGSGVRVKLLEAFASGMPAVSTTLGAEGLSAVSGEYCELADTPDEFASAVIRLLENPSAAAEMAARARRMVERERDARKMAARLVETYRRLLEEKRGKPSATASPVPSNAISTP